MYPILIASFAHRAAEYKVVSKYPDEVLRDGFDHVALLSFCRHQAMQAIRASGDLTDLTPEDIRGIRWRASVPIGYNPDFYASRLELFADNDDGTMRLIYTAPLCGTAYEALPLVLRLGLELLIRKECRGSDPE